MKKILLFLVFYFGMNIACLQACSASAEESPQEYFVRREGNQLAVGSQPFYFNGTNNDHLYHSSHFMISDVLVDAKGLGLTVFRTWASSEGQDTLAKHGYCFQPNPGEYHEPTFRQMDYIIATAKENGIRLILPLVNNWDDGFGGMPQYVRWCTESVNDWSAKSTLTFDLYNDGDAQTADVAIRTGSQWVWHESFPITLILGWNYNISVDLTASTWKTAASGWNYTATIGNLGQLQTVAIGVFGYSHPGAIYIDNIRLDSALYDGLEQKDNWYATDYSYATGAELSTAQVSEGAHSLKMTYSYSYGEYNKAFVEKQPQVEKNDFYTNACCRQRYKDYINYFLNRVNSITGVAYKNDPTILMWELANEPRCESDPSGNTLQAWIEEMAAYIKSIDHNHLVSTGEEGWYNRPASFDWKYDGRLGADYIRNNQSAFIDVCSFHLYPQGYGMSEQDNLNWIQQHVDDAHNGLRKPVYLGEFGITADRNATLLNDFDAGPQGWSIDWNYIAGPVHVESPSRDGNGAIYYTADINEGNSSCGGRIIYPDPGLDYSAYSYLAGWVYIPPAAPADLTAEMYVSSGDSGKWTSGRNQVLSPGNWTQVSISKSWIENGGGDMTKIRSLGIQVKRSNTNYSGEVYYDLIGANMKEVYDAAAQMSERNRLYADWFSLLYAKSADGAAFWQLLAHQDGGTLFPDYWNWGVYYPEDAQTSLIIQDYSLKIKNTTSDPTPPTTPQVTDEGRYTSSKEQLYASWVSFDPESGISEYLYRITQDFPTGTLIRGWTSTGTNNYVTAGALSLQQGKTYYFAVKARNGSGVESQAGYSDGITVDAIAPIGTIRINHNARFTNSTSVNLRLSALDRGGSGLNQMRFSNDNITYSIPQAYAATKFWILTSVSGRKRVYVRFSDKAGNWSRPYSDSIILDTVKPAIGGISDSPDPFNPERGQSLKISYTLSDNLSGSLDVSVYIYTLRGSLVAALSRPSQSLGSRHIYWSGRNSSGVYVPDARYKYRIKAEDQAGNYTYSGYYYVMKR